MILEMFVQVTKAFGQDVRDKLNIKGVELAEEVIMLGTIIRYGK